MSAYLYILHCVDGTTIRSLEERVAEHQAGAYDGYTALRQPVELVFQQHFERLEDAAAAERQVKGWRREKKDALIRGDYTALPSLARRGGTVARPSRRGPTAAPQDDESLKKSEQVRG